MLKGSLVSKINIQHPVITINSIAENKDKKRKIQADDYINKIKSSNNFKINQVMIYNGEVYFNNNQTPNSFNLYIKNINAKFNNIQNISNKQGLMSSFSLAAKAMDDADLSISGKFNLTSKTPAFQIKASLKELSLPKLNPFLKEYTKLKTEQGTFTLFFEAVAANGRIKGYAKPFVKNLVIAKQQDASLGQKIYEGAVSAANKILKNQEQKTTASQIKISGKIDDPDVSALYVLKYLLYHAFIQSLLPSVDNKVSMNDVIYPEKTKEKK
ncbi:MAG: DUF748 domain-containing protein [Proteobacteria bacterium]|nr:DUF748 domain-containing protein [Pseudomonadota bacterium]